MNSEVLDCLEDYAKLLTQIGQVETSVRAYAAAAAISRQLDSSIAARKRNGE